MGLLEKPDLDEIFRFVTEQCFFDSRQIIFHQRAMHGDKVLVGAWRPAVQPTRHNLLAAARRPVDHDTAIGQSQLVDLGVQLLDDQGLPDQFEMYAVLAPQFIVFALQTGIFACTLYRQQQFVGFERLFNIVVSAFANGRHRGFDIAMPTYYNDRQFGVAFAQNIQHFKAIKPTALQPNIEQHKRRAPAGDLPQRSVAVRRRTGRIPLIN